MDIAIIKVIDVCVNYGSHRALNNISLEVMPREVVAVVGPNGSGKTTLLKTIDRILKPIRGSIYIDGRNIESYVQRELA
ncbi:MAG: ATP-binding cassette domain-containing protein, partial [Ignisphaera sp.]